MDVDDTTEHEAGLTWPERLRPTVPDGAMIVAGVLTTVLWSGGVGLAQFAVVALVWSGLWVWRFMTPGWKVWGPLAAIVTVWIAVAGGVHTAERVARDCTTEIAEGLLSTEPVVEVKTANHIQAYGGATSGAPDIRRPGRCGLLDWSHAAVIDVNEFRRDVWRRPDAEPVVPAVVLFDVGPHQGFLFGAERGYAYSPDRTVESCHDLVGRSAANNGYARCTVDERGGGWYWYVAQSSLD